MKRVSQPLDFYFWCATFTSASLALTLSGDLGQSIKSIPSAVRAALTQHQAQPSDFTQAVRQTAQRLGTKPEYLLGVMSFETGGTLDPCQRGVVALDAIHGGTHATGLIQFMPKTAQSLETTPDQLCQMSQSQQMVYVEKYLVNSGFNGGGLGHLYAAIFTGSPTTWDSNPNIGDGYHTLSGAVARIEREHLPKAKEILKR